jgi:DHA1 family multidrug resistance protein-like MFS transporter
MDDLGKGDSRTRTRSQQATIWRRNLYAITIAQALAIMGFSLRESFLPFYLKSLGADSTGSAAIWSGLISAGGAGVMAFSAPFWGVVSDRRGRKPMLLRAMFGALFTVSLMGLATQPWHLLALRFLEGALTGTVTASTALVASSAAKEKLGFSLGLVQTAVFSGASLGPFLGGLLADEIGYRPTFAVAGAFLGSAGLIVLFFVKEEFTPVPRGQTKGLRALRASTSWLMVPMLLTMTGVLFAVRFAQMSTRPILPLYVEHVGGFAGESGDARAASLSGIALGLLGLTSAVAAVYLGRRGDKVGHRKILLGSIFGAGLIYMPMAAVTGVWQLILLQALFGIAAGGLIPAANALIAEWTPRERRGVSFGISAAAGSLGGTFGPLAGSATAASLGFRAAFLGTGLILLALAAGVAYVFARPAPNEAPRHELAKG